jgi:hypothetical protein
MFATPLTHYSPFYQELSLAEGFDIKDGSVFIKCPEVDPNKRSIAVCKSSRYFIVRRIVKTHLLIQVFGDSGNRSSVFS